MNTSLRKLGWHLAAASGFVLPASLFLTGCANHDIHSSSRIAPSSKSPPDLLAFYSGRSRCPAAQEIGRGSRAKPILRELERVSGINEAWLNRGGTQLAVVWSDSGTAETRDDKLQTVLQKHKLTASELT